MTANFLQVQPHLNNDIIKSRLRWQWLETEVALNNFSSDGNVTWAMPENTGDFNKGQPHWKCQGVLNSHSRGWLADSYWKP